MAELVAQVFGDGVLLSRRGAQLVELALEAVARKGIERDGGVRGSAELAALLAVVSLAAAGRTGPASCGGATSGRRFSLTMPASDSRVTVAQAAAIHGVSQAAIRKAIAVGRLAAVRHGPAWSIAETDARMLTIRRRRGRPKDPADGDHRRGESREDPGRQGRGLREVGRRRR